jgi:hypothetical protein
MRVALREALRDARRCNSFEEDSMLKAAAASLVTALIVVGAGWATNGTGAGADTLRPACPHAHYGVDGTMGPAFCAIDNPAALVYYERLGKHLFALGANAAPEQVLAAVLADFHNSTLPILCETYRLAAWREQWHFAGSIAAAAAASMHWPKRWCTEPRFGQIGP